MIKQPLSMLFPRLFTNNFTEPSEPSEPNSNARSYLRNSRRTTRAFNDPAMTISTPDNAPWNKSSNSDEGDGDGYFMTLVSRGRERSPACDSESRIIDDVERNPGSGIVKRTDVSISDSSGTATAVPSPRTS